MNKKELLKAKVHHLKEDPKVRQAFLSMKPEKSIWGILGVVVFFIVPEIIAYIWGVEITQYAQTQLELSTSLITEGYYKLLIMLFEEGMSWFNLGFGLLLLIWLFF